MPSDPHIDTGVNGEENEYDMEEENINGQDYDNQNDQDDQDVNKLLVGDEMHRSGMVKKIMKIMRAKIAVKMKVIMRHRYLIWGT